VLPQLAAHVALRVDGVRVESLDGTLELDVEHTWTQSAWVDTVPRLVADANGGAAFAFQRSFNSITAALALGIALFAGYLWGRLPR
jgi:hypothetical protein